MKSATGTPTYMWAIRMGCATFDVYGKPIFFVIHGRSVFEKSLADSLISVGRLLEAGFKAAFRTPSDASHDGFDIVSFLFTKAPLSRPRRIDGLS
jgi:hypothetical protein